MTDNNRRRLLKGLLASGGLLTLTGCDKLSRSDWFVDTLRSSEKLSNFAQHAITPRKAMAKEFTRADISPIHRPNGSTNGSGQEYQRLAANNFADYALRVDGLVKNPARLSLNDLKALPSRTQITRHDCVEGWSVIGEWTGAKLSAVLEQVQPLPSARYLVFHCADSYGSTGSRYYESIDMEDAYHPQTLLAYGLNGETLPTANGAPLRLRVERQLGYKMAKFIMAIEVVENFEDIEGGNGGFWEDRGYAWYAGI
ncbi:MAG: molybdopterin-binding protein [Marinobacter sp.]|uniref:molybdopterin-binding protein n=1 Tax=Marinobacter sp. AC-23 TaxID=1879031 RepID=UPI0008DD6F60|nr:molybdopterin-binding protein [Marinobacter sp. AC-23]OHY80814.1 molybdopterin-binding protein [Marinobacter sp. AC-23]